MSYLALYRKYRPKSFDDLVGQNEIATIIKNEIINNKISHAYLFSGPRGTGKTSTAKIIAKMVNCSNLSSNGDVCGKCPSCTDNNNVDIVEIDAASNNGVDEIRELRDKVNLVPSYGKYKVYIIDEVHMLTIQAFNALLKTLEEPPSHVIFILATTEPHKIPETVVSRCQKFQFLRFTEEDIYNRLVTISKLEKINVDDSCLYEIAKLCNGGMRDAINMLDQLSSYSNNNIKLEDVYLLNGVVSNDEIVNFFKFLKNNDVTNIISFLENINMKGKKLDQFLVDLIELLKNSLIYLENNNFEFNSFTNLEFIKNISSLFDFDTIYNLIFELNELYNKIKSSDFSLILLVSFFVSFSNKIKVKEVNAVSDNESEKNGDLSSSVVRNNVNNDYNKNKVNKNSVDDSDKKIFLNNAFATASKEKKKSIINNWGKVLDLCSNFRYSSLEGIINDIEVLVVGNDYLIFLVKYDSLIYRIYNYVDELKKLLFEVFSVDYNILFLVNDEWIYEKKKYIDNIKSGYEYKFIERKDNDVITDTNEDKIDNVDKIISLLGDDVVSYE